MSTSVRSSGWIYLLILLGVVLLAAILRFTWLGSVPKGVTGDELQQGYTAYSLLKTGRDEWGDVLPLFPRGFGDYKPPLYVYLAVPSVALFGLDVFSTRVPSALLGTLTVVVLYFLGWELFKSRVIGLLAALVLAISSWHIFYSRTAWESNVALFFFALGLWLFLRGFRRMKEGLGGVELVGSAVCFGLTLFGYFSFHMFTPLFVGGLLGIKIWERRGIRGIGKKKAYWGFVLVFGLFVVLLAYGMLFTGLGRRGSDAAIYNQENILPLRNIQVSDPLPQPWGRVINNKISYLTTQFSENYLGYFSTTFLASPHRSDSSLFNIPGHWLLSVWEIVFLLVAAIVLVRKPEPAAKIIGLWAVLAPVPAALTRNYMHAQRVEVLLLLIPLLAAFGMYKVWGRLRDRRGIREIGVVVMVVVMVFSLLTRVDRYLFHTFNRELGGVHYGYDQIFAYTEANKDKYDRIIFTKTQGQPQIYLAFYQKLDPEYFQSQSQSWKYFEKEFKFVDQINYSLGKYEFTNIDWNKAKVTPNSLIVGSKHETPDGVKAIYEVKDPFGKVLFRVFDTNHEL